MAALEALPVAVANGAFVPWHPPQSQSTGTNIYFGLTPKVKAGPMHGWRIVETRGGAFPLMAVQFKAE